MFAGLQFVHEQVQPLIDAQNKFKQEVGKDKIDVALRLPHPDLKNKVGELVADKLEKVYKIGDRLEREAAQLAVYDEILSDMSVFDDFKVDDCEVTDGQIRSIVDHFEYEAVRKIDL